MEKKGQELSLTVIIVAVIALVVLIVLIAIFTGKISAFTKKTGTCRAAGGTCEASGEACGEFQSVETGTFSDCTTTKSVCCVGIKPADERNVGAEAGG